MVSPNLTPKSQAGNPYDSRSCLESPSYFSNGGTVNKTFANPIVKLANNVHFSTTDNRLMSPLPRIVNILRFSRSTAKYGLLAKIASTRRGKTVSIAANTNGMNKLESPSLLFQHSFCKAHNIFSIYLPAAVLPLVFLKSSTTISKVLSFFGQSSHLRYMDMGLLTVIFLCEVPHSCRYHVAKGIVE